MAERFLMVPADEYDRLLKIRNEKYDNKVVSVDVQPTVNTVEPHKEQPTITSDTKLAIHKVLAAIPKKFRSKGQRLLEYAGDNLRWNVKGEIIRDDNQVVIGSHMSDLIKDMYYSYKKKDLAGKSVFETRLKELHVPISLMGVKEVDRTSKPSKKSGSTLDATKADPYSKWIVI